MQLTSLSPLIGAVGLAVGITSLTVSSAGLARQWPGAYQRIASLVAGLLGLGVLSGSVVLFLADRGQVSDVLTFSGAVGGLTLLTMSATRFRRAPIDRNVSQLRIIAAEMVSSLEDVHRPLEKLQTLVELQAVGNGAPYSTAPIYRQIRHAKELVIAVIGPVGSGKTTTLRTLAHDICKDASRRRRPRSIAVYVDFATMQPGPTAPTSEMIRKHVIESVSGSDATIRAVLEAALKGDADSADWVFLFDSMDEIAIAWPADEIDAQMRSLFDEIRRFLRPGDIRFRAVVAVRDTFATPRGVQKLAIAPLSRSQQKRLMVAAGLRSLSQLKALDRLQILAADVAARPLTFQLWRERLLESGSAPSPSDSAADSVFQLVSATVAGRLEQMITKPDAYKYIHAVAEHAAAVLNIWPSSTQPLPRWELVAEVSRRSGLPIEQVTEAVEVLEKADLVAPARPNSFVFAHRSFQDYFSAKWLIANFRHFDAGSALTDLRWREATVSALRSGPDELRNRLLGEADTIVAQRTQTLLPDVGEFVSVRPSEPLPVTVRSGDPGPPDPLMLYVLSVVSAASHSLGILPQGLRMAADRLVATAFVMDSRPEQRGSLALLRIMTPDIALRAVERALFLGGMLFEPAVVAWDATRRPVQELSRQARAKLAGGLMARPSLLREFDRRSSEKTAGGASEFARDLVACGKISMAILLLLSFVNGTVAFANDSPEGALIGFLAGVAALVCLYRWARYSRVHSTSRLDSFAEPVTVAWIFVSALLGVFAVPRLIYVAVTHFSALPASLIRTYLVTWPACMAAVLLIAEAPTRRSWWLPQWYFARPAFDIARRLRPWRWRNTNIREAAPVLGAVTLLILIANMPLPIADDAQGGTRVYLLIAAFACWILGSYIWRAVRRINDRRFMRATARSGGFDSLVLLQRIRAAAGNEVRLARMIAGLAKVPAASLAGANAALADLTRALTHVERMVPANTKTRIPRGVWDVGPRFKLPEFRQWVEDFDAAYPGRLSWMAAQHVDSLARLVDPGDTPRPT